jgi:hypothetical protein
MTIKKIQDLLRNIFKKHQIDLKFKIDEVLSICDSQIERLMLLQLYNYFQNYVHERFGGSGFSEIHFIEEEITIGNDNVIDIAEQTRLREKIRKYKYRRDFIDYSKYIGFKVKANLSEPSISPSNFVFHEFEIYPQFETKIDGVNYRVDIAIILKRIKNNNIIDTRKIALECDGYDYHSSREQKKSDDIRSRKLKTNGWKEVFRYSGSEIYRIKYIGEVHSNFEEIIKMLMI